MKNIGGKISKHTKNIKQHLNASDDYNYKMAYINILKQQLDTWKRIIRKGGDIQ